MAIECPLDEVVLIEVITSHPSTGAVTDADSTPTFAVYEEVTDTDIGVGGNFVKRTSLTGNYRAQFTASAANGFELGKFYSVIASGTVNAIAGKCVVRTFRVIAAETTAGIPDVNAKQLAGSTQSATDLKDFADDGYDPGTNKVQGVVLTDTVTTYTGNTPQTGDVYPKVDTEIATLVSDVAAVKAKTDNLPSDPADASEITASFSTVSSTLATIAAYIDTEVAAIKAKTDNLPANPAAVGSQMDLVNAPNATALAAIQSGLALHSLLSTVAGYLDTEVAAIKAKTDNLPSDPSDASDVAASFASIAATLGTITSAIPTTASIADKLLGRNEAGGSDGGRTVTSALRVLRNKVDTASVPGFMVVMQEDDTTEAWRAAITTDGSADPITSVDPTT